MSQPESVPRSKFAGVRFWPGPVVRQERKRTSDSLDKAARRRKCAKIPAVDPFRAVAIKMNNANWKDVAELVGIAAIVASLIFVGFQLKQDRAIALAESQGALEESYNAINSFISEHADIWLKGQRNEDLSDEEEVIMSRLVSSLHRRARYAAAMRRNLDRPGKAALRDLARELYHNPGARRIWEIESAREIADWEAMSSSDTYYRLSYREEILAELVKLDSASK